MSFGRAIILALSLVLIIFIAIVTFNGESVTKNSILTTLKSFTCGYDGAYDNVIGIITQLQQERERKRKLSPAMHVVSTTNSSTRSYMNNNEQRPKQPAGGYYDDRDFVGGKAESIDEDSSEFRILYIITSATGYNNGRRGTMKGSDRLKNTLIPLIHESTSSIMSTFDDQHIVIDLYLILSYKLNPDRYNLITNSFMVNSSSSESRGKWTKNIINNITIWDDAMPISYDYDGSIQKDVNHIMHNKLIERSMHLPRQHRYVIKDLLWKYDLFCVFEDDMLIKGQHVKHFLDVSNGIHQLYKESLISLSSSSVSASRSSSSKIIDNSRSIITTTDHNYLSPNQLKHIIPGFIRVEVLLNEEKYPAQDYLSTSIPVDLSFFPSLPPINISNSSINNVNRTLPKHSNVLSATNTTICCSIGSEEASDLLFFNNEAQTKKQNLFDNTFELINPPSSKVMLWETNIEALGVRKMPESKVSDFSADGINPRSTQTKSNIIHNNNNNDKNIVSSSWVVLQRGSATHKGERIDDFWSGNILPKEQRNFTRPGIGDPKYVSSQGGFMATRSQIVRWHTELCQGSFLPPYFSPFYGRMNHNYKIGNISNRENTHIDGLDQRNVEYWSGGLQLFSEGCLGCCSLQRIILIDTPNLFSSSLIYHTSNNKQRQLAGRKHRFVKVDSLLGQLNAVKKYYDGTSDLS